MDEATERAIWEVIEGETRAFQSGDLDAWSAFWERTPRARDIYFSTIAGSSVIEGWDAITANMRDVFDRGIHRSLIAFDQGERTLTCAGDLAWATFTDRPTFDGGRRGVSKQVRILERTGATWRIVLSCVIVDEQEEPGVLTLALDGSGRIIRASDAARAALAGHPWLTISAGRLRAVRRDWDRRLQAAVTDAGRLHGFFQTYRHAVDEGGPADLHIVLGQTDEGGVATIRLTVRDDRTYLHLDGEGQTLRRLHVAKVVYGLSDAQADLARRIAEGQSLKDAAEELGVSVNTLRTHLGRIYDKTGVRTQPALVRLLLSVG